MDGSQITSNTSGFGITSSGSYSPRLDSLQQEYSSSSSSGLSAKDYAALGQQIQDVYSGKSGDMNNSSTDPNSTFSKMQSLLQSTLGAVTGGVGGAAQGYANSAASQSTSGSWADQAKAWLKENGFKIFLVVLGIVFLFGAFLTYRK